MTDGGRPYVIRYHFHLDGGAHRELTVELDHRTLLNRAPLPAEPPEWTRLDFHQCPNCPLKAAETPHCPTAAHLAELVATFSQQMSYDEALVRVELPEREVSRRTTVQAGLSSLIGVHMATSGCPVLGRLRPMVRFHLPFATREETVFRAVATYLVAQYVRSESGLRPDWELFTLVEVYRQVAVVNRAFVERVRGAVEKDANLNALVRLDVFAKALPDSIAEHLSDLHYLFELPYSLADAPDQLPPPGRDVG